MADMSEGAVGTRTTTAYFETREAADAAVHDLVARGIAREQISIAGAEGEARAASDDRSFWDELKDFFLPAEDRHAYAEGLRRGGAVVSVRAEAMDYESVLDVLDRDDAVDLDKQQASWRRKDGQGIPAQRRSPSCPPLESVLRRQMPAWFQLRPQAPRANRGRLLA
jgi:hypothetical protein